MHFVTGVAFTPRQSRLVTSTYYMDETTIWDAQTGTRIGSVKGSIHTELAARFSSKGNLLALGDFDGNVSVVDYGAAEIVYRIADHKAP